MTDRKKPGVAFWATVLVVVVLVGYPLSFGPACWTITRNGRKQNDMFERIYWPIGFCAENGPTFVAGVIKWYAMIGSPPKSTIMLPSNSALDTGFVIDE